MDFLATLIGWSLIIGSSVLAFLAVGIVIVEASLRRLNVYRLVIMAIAKIYSDKREKNREKTASEEPVSGR